MSDTTIQVETEELEFETPPNLTDVVQGKTNWQIKKSR